MIDTAVSAPEEYDFAKMKVGLKTLDDAIVKLGTLGKTNKKFADKDFVLKNIKERNYEVVRKISEYYYDSSGIYARLCQYLAYLYKYDWFVTPYVIKKERSITRLLNDFTKLLNYFDRSDIKRLFGSIALTVVRQGVFYGIVLDLKDKFTIQQLPADYCRSRYYSGMNPAIELNMRYFDTCFSNPQYRLKILSLFPKEIQKAYVLYKENKLPGDYPGDKSGWYMIDPNMTVKFNLNGSDLPPLIGAIPSLIDLDAAQDLDRKKMMQQLLKIIIQKLPVDKNGDLIFDVDEARDIHNNAVGMLKRAVGIDVLTTFADIETVDTYDKNSSTTTDDLQRVERTVYNNLGVSQNLFNTEGSVALNTSVLNDEAKMHDLIEQFQSLLNRIAEKWNKPSYRFGVDILGTTINNYKELSKMYKEQTQIGFSKLLPQVALGHSQSSIIATATFENNILHLSEVMIPPMSSNTMSSDALKAISNKSEGGRPELPDEQKSDKTLANKESIG